MIGEHLTSIEDADAHIGKIADILPAHTSFASNDHFMPVIGFLFSGHGASRHHEAEAAIETDQAAAKMAKRPLASAVDVEPRQCSVLPNEAKARIADTNGSKQVKL